MLELLLEATSHGVLRLRAEQRFLATPFPLSELSLRGKVENLVHNQAVALAALSNAVCGKGKQAQ